MRMTFAYRDIKIKIDIVKSGGIYSLKIVLILIQESARHCYHNNYIDNILTISYQFEILRC